MGGKKEEEEKKKVRGVGYFRKRLSAGTNVNTRDFGHRVFMTSLTGTVITISRYLIQNI